MNAKDIWIKFYAQMLEMLDNDHMQLLTNKKCK
jgi:hypothetical protein